MRTIIWKKNGDHPDDQVGQLVDDGLGGVYTRMEGKIVRFFRRPEPQFESLKVHELCGRVWHDHGWIDLGDSGITVCPGDRIPVRQRALRRWFNSLKSVRPLKKDLK